MVYVCYINTILQEYNTIVHRYSLTHNKQAVKTRYLINASSNQLVISMEKNWGLDLQYLYFCSTDLA